MSTYETSLKWTLNWEGGYVNDPDDPGGATNRGITQGVYDSYRTKNNQPIRPVKEISEAELQAIYKKYWDASKAEGFGLPLARVLFDTAVNFGAGRAIQFLNQVLGLGDSLKVTAATRNSIQYLKQDPPKQLEKAKAICEKRIEYRHKRVAEKPSQQKFLKGWLRRDNDLLKILE